MKWVILVFVPLIAIVGAGQTPAITTQRIRELEEQLSKLRQEVQSLRGQLAEQQKAHEGVAQPALQERELSQRLASVELKLVELTEKLEELMAVSSEMHERLDRFDVMESRRPVISTYGHITGRDFQGEKGVWDAEAFELVFSAQPHERITLFSELEFERAAAVGGVRGGEILTEQAHVTFGLAKGLALRAGVLLVPFGNVNVDHYAPRRDVISRPLVAYAVAPGDWTDNGIGILGRASLGKTWSLGYEVDVVAGLGSNISALGLRKARQKFGEDNNQNKAVVGRLYFRRGRNFEVGGSFYLGKYDDESRRTLGGFAVDSTLRIGLLTFTGEYERFEADRGANPKAVFEGSYIRGTLLLGEHLFHSGKLAERFPEATLGLVAQWDWVSIVGPYSEAWVTNEEKRLTWGIVFRPTDHLVFKLNYEDNQATNMPLFRGNKRGWLGAVGYVF